MGDSDSRILRELNRILRLGCPVSPSLGIALCDFPQDYLGTACSQTLLLGRRHLNRPAWLRRILIDCFVLTHCR